MPISHLQDLKEGYVYSITSKQFNAINKAKLISFDATGLNRNIAYFQFTERNYQPISKERLKKMFEQDEYPRTVFAIWDFELSKQYEIEQA